ncbi:Uncharacterised protein [Achromobacter denitrificans]|nr:hypothetical protein LMG1231_02624 [Achromobacter denitrificans]SUU09328.1 Uncharacterised protein [Achromobacter denitrificans]
MTGARTGRVWDKNGILPLAGGIRPNRGRPRGA